MQTLRLSSGELDPVQPGRLQDVVAFDLPLRRRTRLALTLRDASRHRSIVVSAWMPLASSPSRSSCRYR